MNYVEHDLCGNSVAQLDLKFKFGINNNLLF